MSDDLKFRDQAAISIFQMLIAEERLGDAPNSLIAGYAYYLKTGQSNYKWAFDKMEELAHLSYKISDHMRKARLAVFE